MPKFFQIAVFVGVGFLLIYWRETDPTVREPLSNGYLIGVIAFGCAWLATAIPRSLIGWLRIDGNGERRRRWRAK